MFVGVKGTTQLYNLMDTITAMGMVTSCLGILRRVSADRGGRVVKTLGGEVLLIFAHAGGAAQAAVQMLDAVSRQCEHLPADAEGVRLSIGMHHGTVLLEDEDVFGDAVNVAARVMALAKPDQVLLTRPVLDLLPRDIGSQVRFYEETTLRGKPQPLQLYELLWQAEEATDVPPEGRRPPSECHSRLCLRYGGGAVTLGDDRPAVTLGRSEVNDLVIPSILASRRHARIEHRYGKFVVYDESTNGTFVVNSDGRVWHIRRGEHPLKGDGLIALGMPPDPRSDLVIHYACE